MPSTSGLSPTNYPGADEDEAGLAAAVESLCSFGTPRTGPVHLPADVPPVPPLPARFASYSSYRLSGSMATPTMPQELLPPPLTHRISDERDVKMADTNATDADDDFDQRSTYRGRSDEDDDGVFGSMEE